MTSPSTLKIRFKLKIVGRTLSSPLWARARLENPGKLITSLDTESLCLIISMSAHYVIIYRLKLGQEVESYEARSPVCYRSKHLQTDNRSHSHSHLRATSPDPHVDAWCEVTVQDITPLLPIVFFETIKANKCLCYQFILWIIFLIIRMIHWSIKCKKRVKMSITKQQKPNVGLFLTKHPKHKDNRLIDPSVQLELWSRLTVLYPLFVFVFFPVKASNSQLKFIFTLTCSNKNV